MGLSANKVGGGLGNPEGADGALIGGIRLRRGSPGAALAAQPGIHEKGLIRHPFGPVALCYWKRFLFHFVLILDKRSTHARMAHNLLGPELRDP